MLGLDYDTKIVKETPSNDNTSCKLRTSCNRI